MQQLLQGLIVEGLAQDQGVAPTDAEVNTQYDNIKMLQDARNIKGFDQALTDAGMTPDVFKALQVKPQLAQLKLLTKGLTVTDADVQTFYNANKDKQFTKRCAPISSGLSWRLRPRRSPSPKRSRAGRRLKARWCIRWTRTPKTATCRSGSHWTRSRLPSPP